jgi:hypothetical protein
MLPHCKSAALILPFLHSALIPSFLFSTALILPHLQSGALTLPFLDSAGRILSLHLLITWILALFLSTALILPLNLLSIVLSLCISPSQILTSFLSAALIPYSSPLEGKTNSNNVN